jgi:hypothetical protein
MTLPTVKYIPMHAHRNKVVLYLYGIFISSSFLSNGPHLTCWAVLSPGHGPSASWTSLFITFALKVENGGFYILPSCKSFNNNEECICIEYNS